MSQYPEKRVELASGHTSLRATPVGTLIGPVGTEVIVSMGCLIELGCRIAWRGKQCTVIHPERGSLAVNTTSGCPKVSRETAYELVKDIEDHRLHQLAHQIEARRLAVSAEGIGIRDVLAKLVQAFRDGNQVEPWIQVLVAKVWPGAPEEVLNLTWTCRPENNHGVPYNRSQRKRHERAQALVLNMFAGATRKPIDRACVDGRAEQVPVDQEHDLLAPATFWYLLRLCSIGKVRAILAKPPCSICSRYGSGESSSAQRQKVLEADELMYRMFILMLVTQAASHTPQDPWTLIAFPEDSRHYTSPVYMLAAAELGLSLTHGDQGPYGHTSTMPTAWASNTPLPHFTSRGPGTQANLGPHATTASASLDSWAPGILKHIADELVCVLGFDRIQKAAFDYEAHVKRGHWPPYRGCPQCILGQACQRPHRWVRIPEAFSLSLDLAGPYATGVDDVSSKRRFALVGVYLLPLDRFGRPLLSEAQQKQVQNEGYISKVTAAGAEVEAGLGAFSDDELAEDLDGLLQTPDPESVRDASVREESVEKDVAVDKDPSEPEEGISELKFVEVPFVRLLNSKRPGEVAEAISSIANELKRYGFPLTRIHTDSGSEFTTGPLAKLAHQRDWTLSHAGPEEPNSAGRAENAIRRLKAQTRTYLAQVDDNKRLWPLAFQAAVHAWRSQTLERLGWKQRPLAAWGTKVQVLVRSWLRRRQQDWRPRAEHAVVLAPATHVRNAVVVLNPQGKVKVATRVYKPEVSDPPDAHDAALQEGEAEFREVPAHPTVPILRRRSKGPGIPARRVRSKTRVAKVAVETRPWDADERCAQSLLNADVFDLEAAKEFLLSSVLLDRPSRPRGVRTSGSHHVFGLWRHGGVTGVSRYVERCPQMTQLLAKMLSTTFPGCCFTTALVSVDASTIIHRDVQTDARTQHLVLPVAVPEFGGGLWVELPGDDTSVEGSTVEVLPSGRQVIGRVVPLDQPFQFSAKRWHRVMPSDSRRVVVIGYNVSCAARASHADLQKLSSLGFVLPDDVRQGGGHSQFVNSEKYPQNPKKNKENLKHVKRETLVQNERVSVVPPVGLVQCCQVSVEVGVVKEPASGHRSGSASETASMTFETGADVGARVVSSSSVESCDVCVCGERDCRVCACKFLPLGSASGVAGRQGSEAPVEDYGLCMPKSLVPVSGSPNRESESQHVAADDGHSGTVGESRCSLDGDDETLGFGGDDGFLRGLWPYGGDDDMPDLFLSPEDEAVAWGDFLVGSLCCELEEACMGGTDAERLASLLDDHCEISNLLWEVRERMVDHTFGADEGVMSDGGAVKDNAKALQEAPEGLGVGNRCVGLVVGCGA